MRICIVFLFGLIILSNAVVFAGGGKDVNGLKQNDYDKNGWAYVNGQWVPSPKGAVYLDEFSATTVVPEEIVYEEITDVTLIEEQLETEQNGLDINGLRKSDYDINGWALKDEKWVASPTGALYAGQENYNLEYLISSIVNEMTDEEKGLLKATLLYGKNMEKNVGNIINSPDQLREYGKDVTAKWIVTQLDDSFTKGTGFVDALTGKWLNYGQQLDVMIKDVLVKELKVPKPKFTKNANTVQGAIQRENWIAETLLDNFIASMTEDERMELAAIVTEELAKEGVIIEPSANIALASGGLFALRKNLGFKFHIYVAKIANTVVRFITGRGLSLPANRLLQMITKRIVMGAVPVIGVIATIWTITDIPGLINPRNYDKYIPAVFIIGLNRLSQNDT